jgi:hypothetical protein
MVKGKIIWQIYIYIYNLKGTGIKYYLIKITHTRTEIFTSYICLQSWIREINPIKTERKFI